MGAPRRDKSKYTAFFESWRGRYADSPRAISQQLAERYPQVRQIWVGDEGMGLPGGVHRVRRHSPEYFSRLLAADFLVANDIVSKHIVKGPNVNYLQTWHGTPLKTIGYDEVIPAYRGAAAHHKRMTRDVKKWDQLISPSPACTEMFKTAFGFTGMILETGYPRNDILNASDADQIRARVRASLGIEAEARVVLYTPTWRDDVRDESGAFKDPQALDVDTFMRNTDDDTVLLVRMHKVVRTRLPEGESHRAIDVSDYPEISELFLAADVLVSDYSSAIYDFAVTGKPIILFAYDLEHYRSGVRRLYFDYESWAPGPIVTTTEGLAEAVTDLTHTGDHPKGRFTDTYKRFVEQFCPFEDGSATDRVIDAVFAPILDGPN